ncbi:restriction endonuclease subunit S [Vibrio breoganii]
MMSLNQTPINQLITDNIDTWTSTVKTKATTGRGSSKKLELYGVKKLRELILELAIRGQLVPQDLTDEPASYFFPDMEEEKSALVKASKLKKQKATPQIDGASVPYELPAQWVWMGLPDVTFFQEGPGILAKDFRDAGVPLIRISGMHGEKVSLEGCNFLDESMVLKKWEHFKLDLGDIVLSSSASLGKVAKVSEETVGAIVYTGLIRFKTYAALSENYMSRFFESMEFARQINSSKTGAAIKHFGPTHLKKMVIPVPPLKEQHRIVAKVDELMTLCDQLEQQTEASIEAHQVLVTTLLDTLTNSANAEELMQNWQMIAEHFDTLFTTIDSIDQLKQTILQLAVMGKLVPQEPNDEPATKLLERIAEEKAQLIKEKKIKKQKALPPIADDEKPFELPTGWTWERLGNTGIGATGKTPSTKIQDYFDGKFPFVGPGQITKNGQILEAEKFLSPEGLLNSTEAVQGDILMVCIGGSIGKGAITNQTIGFNQQINSIRPVKMISEYLYTAVTTETFYKALIEKSTGSATPIINRSKWEELLIPIAPLTEQRRIVDKVYELMTICDQLKVRLKESQLAQLQLTDAIVEKAV